MKHVRALTVPLFVGLAVVALATAGCGGGSSDPSGPADDHTNIILKDRLGNALTSDSTEPYSPRQTCGTCHDVDSITNGYHFTQGRDDAGGNYQMADDFFGDNRTWLKSDGMFGKW